MIIYAKFESILTERIEKEPFGAIRSYFGAKYEPNQNFLENPVWTIWKVSFSSNFMQKIKKIVRAVFEQFGKEPDFGPFWA